MAALDTNVLVRWLLKDDPQQTRLAQSLLLRAREHDEALWVSNTVFLETEWVLRSRCGAIAPAHLRSPRRTPRRCAASGLISSRRCTLPGWSAARLHMPAPRLAMRQQPSGAGHQQGHCRVALHEVVGQLGRAPPAAVGRQGRRAHRPRAGAEARGLSGWVPIRHGVPFLDHLPDVIPSRTRPEPQVAVEARPTMLRNNFEY